MPTKSQCAECGKSYMEYQHIDGGEYLLCEPCIGEIDYKFGSIMSKVDWLQFITDGVFDPSWLLDPAKYRNE